MVQSTKCEKKHLRCEHKLKEISSLLGDGSRASNGSVKLALWFLISPCIWSRCFLAKAGGVGTGVALIGWGCSLCT